MTPMKKMRLVEVDEDINGNDDISKIETRIKNIVENAENKKDSIKVFKKIVANLEKKSTDKPIEISKNHSIGISRKKITPKKEKKSLQFDLMQRLNKWKNYHKN